MNRWSAKHFERTTLSDCLTPFRNWNSWAPRAGWLRQISSHWLRESICARSQEFTRAMGSLWQFSKGRSEPENRCQRTSKFTVAPAFTRSPGAGFCDTMMLAGVGCGGGAVGDDPARETAAL